MERLETSEWPGEFAAHIISAMKTASRPKIGNVGIENWNIGELLDGTNFLFGCTIAQATMDTILINWEAQPHKLNVTINFGLGNYTLGGAAQSAYDALVLDGWVITGITGV